MRQEIRYWIKSLEFSLTRDEHNHALIIREVIKQMWEEINSPDYIIVKAVLPASNLRK